MNNVVPDQTARIKPEIQTLAAMSETPTEQSAWPAPETPDYMVNQTPSSYSRFSGQMMIATKQSSHENFIRDIAAIHASLSQRQERLNKEFETAIFDNLNSLYES